MSSNPNLLDLPLELVDAILAEAIRVRSLRRAFRLRLVNRLFATEVISVVNAYRLLDNCQDDIRTLGDIGADYMSRRLLYTNFPVGARYSNIRSIAARLALEDDENVRDETYPTYVKALCTRAAAYRGRFSMAAICLQPCDHSDPYDEKGVRNSYFKYDLMCAAVYFNKLSIIEERSKNPFCLSILMGSFGDPYELAILRGHSEAFDLLFRKLPEHSIYRYKIRVLHYACEVGAIDMAKKIMRETSYSQSMEHLEAALQTPSVAIFEMLMRMKKATSSPTLSEDRLEQLLNTAARKGWSKMVEHLLPLCASVNTHDALVGACKSGHTAAVRLLLDHGAEISGIEIGAAAHKGRWDVVKLLIQRGANINGDWQETLPDTNGNRQDIMPDTNGNLRHILPNNNGNWRYILPNTTGNRRDILPDINRKFGNVLPDPNEGGNTPPIVAAVAFEREDLIRQFVGLGARLDGKFGKEAIDKAKIEGLESMLGLLEELNVDMARHGRERR